jgi:two-component system chemotaxis response regulator CheB
MSKIRVVVVDDSDVCSDAIAHILEEDGDIQVVGRGRDGREGLDVVQRERPQLVTLDVEMPKMDGLAAVEQIMATCPVPILIVTGRPPELRSVTLFEAVRRGALDVVAKPVLGRAEQAEALRVLVRRLAQVPVMRHLAGRRTKRPSTLRPRAAGGTSSTHGVRVIGIGASAGGPAAVATLLGKLPKDFPACVVLVQHLLPDFAESYVRFLRAETELAIELVDGSSPMRGGTVLVAPDDRHLVASPHGSVVVSDAPPIKGYRPSADALFESLARHFGPAAAGVVLSGIGDDGAAGLLSLRRAGGLTIAQDEQSSIVFGMPRAARDTGAAARVLSPEAIAEALVAEAARVPRPRKQGHSR